MVTTTSFDARSAKAFSICKFEDHVLQNGDALSETDLQLSGPLPGAHLCLRNVTVEFTFLRGSFSVVVSFSPNPRRLERPWVRAFCERFRLLLAPLRLEFCPASIALHMANTDQRYNSPGVLTIAAVPRFDP